jgi:hypothetical protein
MGPMGLNKPHKSHLSLARIIRPPFNIVNANSRRDGFTFDMLNAKIDAEANDATMRHLEA